MGSVVLYHGSGERTGFPVLRALDCLRFERSEKIYG